MGHHRVHDARWNVICPPLHVHHERQTGVLQVARTRVYLGIIFAASILMAIGIWGGPVLTTIRDSLFTSVTIVTTTGYGTADFATWGPVLEVMIVGLMFVGGMAGSTSGSIKTDRLLILSGASRTDVRRIIHPRGVFVTRVGKKPVPDLVVETVQTFFLLYMFAFMTGVFAIAVIGFAADSSLDLVTMVSGLHRRLATLAQDSVRSAPRATISCFLPSANGFSPA